MGIYKEIGLSEHPCLEEIDKLLEEMNDEEFGPFHQFKYNFLKNFRNKLQKTLDKG